MSEESPIQPFVDAISNIKDTAKWLVAALGAVLAVMLGGVQLNAFGFSDPSGVNPLVWGALAITVAAIVCSLYLAVEVLVSDGVSLDALKAAPPKEGARALINKQWSYLPSKTGDQFGDLVTEFEALATKQAKSGLDDKEEKEFQADVTLLKVAVNIANWQQTLKRFKRLRWSMLALVPVISAAAAILASAAQPSREDGKALDVPIEATLPATAENLDALIAAGWTSACTKRGDFPVLIYKEYLPGIGEAATHSTAGCRQLRVVVIDRKRILKVL